MSTDAFNYVRSRATADRLIRKFGVAAVLRRSTAGGNPAAPTYTTADFATYAVRVEFTVKQMQGGTVLDNDERWLIAAGPLAALSVTSISPGDKLVIGTTEKPVLVAKPLAPAGTVVMFDGHIRL